VFINDDSRRILIEWISNEPFCSAKAVVAKTSALIGNHYHREKNEKFLLLAGKAKRVVIGDVERVNILAPEVFDVPKGTHHSFELEPDSILLGVADKPHDTNDEIRSS